MNHSLLLIIKKAGEAAIRSTGHPAIVIAAGIAIGIVTVAQAFARDKRQ